jgi:hypothetical protein
MSSLLRISAKKIYTPTRLVPVNSATYSDSSTSKDLLFPFMVSKNGELDISYTNSFKEDMIDISNQTPTQGGDDPSTLSTLLGSTRIITSLGDNFKEYIRAWRMRTIDEGSDILLTSKRCIAINVRSTIFGYNNAYQIDNTPPTSNLIDSVSKPSNNFLTTWIFKTPLTIEITENDVKKYISFVSIFDND